MTALVLAVSAACAGCGAIVESEDDFVVEEADGSPAGRR